MSERERLTPKERKAIILDAALRLAVRVGYTSIRRDAVATEAGCSNGLVNKYYGSLKQLRRDLMREAVRVGNVTVIAQGLALNDQHARKASEDIKQLARASL
jgi:AcrR family transcriptional regulator